MQYEQTALPLGEPGPSCPWPIHLSDALAYYLDERRPALSTSTFTAYTYQLQRFLRAAGDPPLADLRRSLIVDYIRNDGLHRTRCPRSQREVLGLIRRALKWLTEAGLLVRSPAATIPVPRSDDPELRYFPVADLRAVLQNPPDRDPVRVRDHTLVTLLALTGLRIGEASRLEVRDIDIPGRIIHVLGKGGHRSTVPMQLVLRNALQRWLEVRPSEPPSALLFVSLTSKRNARGMSYNALRIAAIRHLKQRGRAGTAHKLRHSFATLLARQGTSAPLIQRALRHRDVRCASRYVHLAAIDIRPAVDQLALAIT